MFKVTFLYFIVDHLRIRQSEPRLKNALTGLASETDDKGEMFNTLTGVALKWLFGYRIKAYVVFIHT